MQNSKLPELSDIEDRMLFLLYTKYKEYPLPENYLKRIVDRLSDKADGWDNDLWIGKNLEKVRSKRLKNLEKV